MNFQYSLVSFDYKFNSSFTIKLSSPQKWIWMSPHHMHTQPPLRVEYSANFCNYWAERCAEFFHEQPYNRYMWWWWRVRQWRRFFFSNFALLLLWMGKSSNSSKALEVVDTFCSTICIYTIENLSLKYEYWVLPMLSYYRLWNKCYRLLCTLIRRLNDDFSLSLSLSIYFFFFFHSLIFVLSFVLTFHCHSFLFLAFFLFLQWSLYCTLRGLTTSSINSIAPIRTTQKSCFDTLLSIVQSPLNWTCFRSVFFFY